MNSCELSMFGVLWSCTVNEILEEEEVSGATLDN
jgi:hypothetical protein